MKQPVWLRPSGISCSPPPLPRKRHLAECRVRPCTTVPAAALLQAASALQDCARGYSARGRWQLAAETSVDAVERERGQEREGHPPSALLPQVRVVLDVGAVVQGGSVPADQVPVFRGHLRSAGAGLHTRVASRQQASWDSPAAGFPALSKEPCGPEGTLRS